MTHFYRKRLETRPCGRQPACTEAHGGGQYYPELFERVLLTPVKPDLREGADILWRERDGIRIVVLENPTPPTGAKLVKTVYRIEAQAKAR